MNEGSRKSGIVYLVGAGPGHPGLITRMGYDLLQHCDAVAYDALIPMELISELPERVEKYYVGKRSGKHSFPQSQINELLAGLAQRGLKVVRLKGGDPFIYGRSGEEAEYLAAAGIPVAMVPGVTAASAAAALSGFSLTNRQSSSWVFLATGHAAESSYAPVPWEKIGTMSGGTLVIYMGLANLDRVVDQLLASGMASETPAVAVQAASTGLQRCIEAPLMEISAECRRQKLRPPALIIVGETARHAASSAGGSIKPMAGKTVLLTCPPPSMMEICALLRENGAEPIPHPAIIRTRVNDVEGWERFQELANVGGVCLFQHEAEVRFFTDELLAHDLDMRRLSCFKVIAIGKATETALLSVGIRADERLHCFDPSALNASISKLNPKASLPVISVCGDFSEYPLEANVQTLCRGAIALTVCRDTTAVWDAHWGEELIANPPDYIAFTSAAEVDGFMALLGREKAKFLADKSRTAAMNDSVSRALLKHDLPLKLRAHASDMEAFVRCLATDSIGIL